MKTHLIKFAAQSIKNLRGILAGLITTLIFFNVLPKVWSQTLPPLFWAGNAETLPANAGSGTWTTSTFSGFFAWSSSLTSTANGTWVQGSVAHFLGSGQPTPLVTLNTNITAAGINFDPGANPFTIDTSGNTLTINGPGIVNTSLKTQTIDNSVQPIISGPLTVAGSTTFFSASTAGNAAITNDGATVTGGPGASTEFHDLSSAGSATITNNPPQPLVGAAASHNSLVLRRPATRRSPTTAVRSAAPAALRRLSETPRAPVARLSPTAAGWPPIPVV